METYHIATSPVTGETAPPPHTHKREIHIVEEQIVA